MLNLARASALFWSGYESQNQQQQVGMSVSTRETHSVSKLIWASALFLLGRGSKELRQQQQHVGGVVGVKCR